MSHLGISEILSLFQGLGKLNVVSFPDIDSVVFPCNLDTIAAAVSTAVSGSTVETSLETSRLVANGIRAEIIPKICEVWLDASYPLKHGNLNSIRLRVCFIVINIPI